ncbi:MAG: LacI family DNA-binding transcriptional regulator [Solirubrobacterales bacterium]
MGSSKPTIVDVAEAAGVAVGTASNALSGKGRVSGATRARVAKAAEELSYVPNRGASGLPTGKTMAIGIRFGHDSTIPGGAFFIEVLDAAAEAADKAGYGLLIRRSGRPLGDQVDAEIVVDPTQNDDLVAPGGIPVVSIGRNTEPSVPWVDVDHRAVMSTLLEHLASLAPADGGAWFVTLPQRLGFVEALEDSFREWCADREMAAEVLEIPDASEEVVEIVLRQLDQGGEPALIVTALDRQAVGVRHALAAAGLDVSVGSASDGVVLGLLDPPVSAMSLDGAAHGETAVRMVLDWIRTGEAPGNVLLPARLRIRS